MTQTLCLPPPAQCIHTNTQCNAHISYPPPQPQSDDRSQTTSAEKADVSELDARSVRAQGAFHNTSILSRQSRRLWFELAPLLRWGRIRFWLEIAGDELWTRQRRGRGSFLGVGGQLATGNWLCKRKVCPGGRSYVKFYSFQNEHGY